MWTTRICETMDTHRMQSLTASRLADGRVRYQACFETEEEARAFQSQGWGGWVLGVYWYDHTWTRSEVMRTCPASGAVA